jgi:hypothetical protein
MRVPLNAREYARAEGISGPGLLLSQVVRFLARLFRSQRRRPSVGRRPDDDQGFGAGDRSPLIPRLPLLSGSAAAHRPSTGSG